MKGQQPEVQFSCDFITQLAAEHIRVTQKERCPKKDSNILAISTVLLSLKTNIYCTRIQPRFEVYRTYSFRLLTPDNLTRNASLLHKQGHMTIPFHFFVFHILPCTVFTG